MEIETESARLANRNIERLRSLVQSTAFVGMPEIIKLIQGLSTRAFTITIDELAEIIEQDVAITARVIGSANTVGYNPTGTPVYTVSQSIQLMGFDRVRNLAMSMLLSENSTIPSVTMDQRDAAAFALSAGLMAQNLMEMHFGDPERAFVCTSLRCYGRLMMTAFMNDEYREAQNLFDEMGEDSAFREVFGLTPIELSLALLQSTQIPKDILRSLQRVSPLMMRVPTNKPDDDLMVLADFSVRVCELVTDATIDAEHFKIRLRVMLKSYGDGYHFDKDKVQDALRNIVTRYESFAEMYKLKRAPNNTMRLVFARAEEKNPPEDIELEYVASRHRAAERRRARRSVEDLNSRKAEAMRTGRRIDAEILQESVKALSQMVGVESPDLEAVHKEASCALATALTLDCGILMRRDENGDFKYVYGAGGAAANLRSAIEQINASSRDVFGISISRAEDVLVSDARKGTIIRYVPVWLKLNSAIMSLIILPVIEGNAVAGVLFGLRCRGEPLTLDGATVQALRELRLRISSAWRKVPLPKPAKSG
jgi:HD-like signal output (HDOD) protein